MPSLFRRVLVLLLTSASLLVVSPSFAVDAPSGGVDSSGGAAHDSSTKYADLPDLFAPAAGICSLTGSDITCDATKIKDTNIGVSIEMPICEMFEQALQKNSSLKETYGKYACSELLDPLPKNSFGASTYCVRQKIERTASKGIQKITLSLSQAGPSTGNADYCNAILTETGTGLGGLFDIVRLLYDASLPILIALAVISLVGVGVFIMYAPGGGEETMKKAKEMGIRILSGFLLLLLLRVFLGFISTDLFAAPDVNPNSNAATSSALMSDANLSQNFRA